MGNLLLLRSLVLASFIIKQISGVNLQKLLVMADQVPEVQSMETNAHDGLEECAEEQKNALLVDIDDISSKSTEGQSDAKEAVDGLCMTKITEGIENGVKEVVEEVKEIEEKVVEEVEKVEEKVVEEVHKIEDEVKAAENG